MPVRKIVPPFRNGKTGEEALLGSIERGTVFVYYGPRHGLLRRRGVAAGVIVAIDEAIGVIHVRTLRPRGEASVTDIGHIPILWSAFARSLHSLGERMPEVADNAMREVATWRKRHAADEVGAFSRPLWEAERMAWETVPAADKALGTDKLYIAYAYPTRDSHGRFRGVEVGVHHHD